MHPLLTLVLAIGCELIATSSLKASQGFTRLWPSVLVAVGYGASFYLLAQTLKVMPLGVVYAIWSGLGTAGTAAIGVLLWREALDLPRLAGIALIIAGVLVLNLYTRG
jgi:small multidrug resistance pump